MFEESVERSRLCFQSLPRDRRRSKIIRTAREFGGDGFFDMICEEVEEHIEEYQEVLTNEELEDLVSHLQRKKKKLK